MKFISLMKNLDSLVFVSLFTFVSFEILLFLCVIYMCMFNTFNLIILLPWFSLNTFQHYVLFKIIILFFQTA